MTVSEISASDVRLVEDRVSFIFTTIGRNECARRLVESVRRIFPRIEICVGDQNARTAEMADFYQTRNVEGVWLDYDCGISIGRNAAAARTTKPFVLIGDDDFVLTQRSDAASAVRFLEAHPDAGVVGGSLIDVSRLKDGGEDRVLRRYEKFMLTDKRAGGLLLIPIDYFPARPVAHDGNLFSPCDMTLNWAMMRREIPLDPDLAWPSEIKCNGEHESFFLNLKEHSQYGVFYFPGMEADHLQEQNEAYRRLRNRQQGWQAFSKRWGLEWMIQPGIGLRYFSDFGNLLPHGTRPEKAGSAGAPAPWVLPGPAAGEYRSGDLLRELVRNTERGL